MSLTEAKFKESRPILVEFRVEPSFLGYAVQAEARIQC